MCVGFRLFVSSSFSGVAFRVSGSELKFRVKFQGPKLMGLRFWGSGCFLILFSLKTGIIRHIQIYVHSIIRLVVGGVLQLSFLRSFTAFQVIREFLPIRRLRDLLFTLPLCLSLLVLSREYGNIVPL